jgi:D-aminoacyl-tRNA deacylase
LNLEAVLARIMIGFAYSVRDPAGSGVVNYIASRLKLDKSSICKGAVECYEAENFVLAGFSEDVVYFDFLDVKMPIEAEFYVVISRHSSEAGVKSYTVHATGNFSKEALYGGRPRELGITHPAVMFKLLRGLKNSAVSLNRLEYEVSYEATHHGPTSLSKPLVFIEIGSSRAEWSDLVNHAVIGDTLLEFLREYPNLPECTSSIGIGGGHYPRKFTDIALSENVCFGHIIPKYALSHLDFEILDMMTMRTAIKPVQIIVEKKSTRREHRELVEMYAERRKLTLRYV